MRPLVRTATPEDFDAWFALFSEVAGEGRWLGAELPMDPDVRRISFEQVVGSDDGVVLVVDAPDGEGMVGLLSVSLSAGGLADLGMAVAAGERGTGVGSTLMEAALAWTRARGAHKLILEVWPHNHAARALYAKFGFVTEGRKRRHWKRRNGALWDGVLMGRVLDETTPGGPESYDWARPPAPMPFPDTGLGGREGLVVRQWSGADVPALVAAVVDDAEVAAWLGAHGDADPEEVAQAWTSGGRQTAREGTGLRLAIVDGDRLAGCLNLHVDPHDPAAGGLGYLIFPQARRRGVATAAVGMLTAWALGGGTMRRLEINTDVDNVAARRVAERAGFELEGVRRAWRMVHAEPRDFASYARVAAS